MFYISVILSWLLPANVVHATISDGILVKKDEIVKGVANISTALLEEDVDVNRVERYFTNQAWIKVKRLIEALKLRKSYFCGICRKAIDEGEETILCNCCMEWMHFTCCNIKKRPKIVYWFCCQCKNKAK